MLKRKIAGLVIAGLFVGVAQAANVEHPTAGAEGGEAWGKVTYTFNPSAEQLAVEKSTGSFLPSNSSVYRAFGKVEYLFNQDSGASGQRVASATFPSAWTQWID